MGSELPQAHSQRIIMLLLLGGSLEEPTYNTVVYLTWNTSIAKKSFLQGPLLKTIRGNYVTLWLPKIVDKIWAKQQTNQKTEKENLANKTLMGALKSCITVSMKLGDLSGILLGSWESGRLFACRELYALTGLCTCSGKI